MAWKSRAPESAGRLCLQKEGCGQGKEFEHTEFHAVFNTRIVTGFRLYGLTTLQSKTKAAGEVQQVSERCIKCKNTIAESFCKCTKTKIRQVKRGAGTK